MARSETWHQSRDASRDYTPADQLLLKLGKGLGLLARGPFAPRPSAPMSSRYPAERVAEVGVVEGERGGERPPRHVRLAGGEAHEGPGVAELLARHHGAQGGGLGAQAGTSDDADGDVVGPAGRDGLEADRAEVGHCGGAHGGPGDDLDRPGGEGRGRAHDGPAGGQLKAVGCHTHEVGGDAGGPAGDGGPAGGEGRPTVDGDVGRPGEEGRAEVEDGAGRGEGPRRRQGRERKTEGLATTRTLALVGMWEMSAATPGVLWRS